MIRTASIFSAYILALLLMATAYAAIPSGTAVANSSYEHGLD